MIGTVLGHYRLLETIGSGGMGEVFRAHDDHLDRDVALKILKASLVTDPDRLRRFQQEARAAAALSHPNIVAIYDNGVHEGAPYIVSELLEGQTVRERLQAGPISVRQASEFGVQIADGLMVAHEKHIVHRDLKPENLFITRDGRIKILDFGIAKLTVQENSGEGADVLATTQTRVGTVLGTMGYMSPEQVRGRNVDHRTDIFSLGAILYEMVTGKRAFTGESEADTMMAVLQAEPVEIAVVRPGIPASFERIVLHCLEKDPEKRFQSARDLAFALGNVTGTTTTRFLPRPSWIYRLRKASPWALAAVVAIAAAVTGRGCANAPHPEYHRLTFERGTVYSARFTPDGHSVLYGAAWNGNPLQLFSTVEDSPLARPLDLPPAYLLGVSRKGELALSLRWTHGARRDLVGGVLAHSPPAAGTPREILEDVRWADWSPNEALAVVHHIPGHNRLEFPIGTVLYQTTGAISNIRFSPTGDRIAFMDHPGAWDDSGSVCVIDLAGNKTTLSEGWDSEDGLAWSPSGKEIWFTAARDSASSRALWAVDRSGRTREILGVPGGITLQDIATDGRVLLTVDAERLAMEWAGSRAEDVRDLSWYEWSIARDLSADGQRVLFEEDRGTVGQNYAVAIRNVDGSPPIRLGDGTVGGLSPDGKWALSVFPGPQPRVTMLPTGAGQPHDIPVPGLERLEGGAAHFMPNGREIVINGNEPGHPVRTYLVDINGASPPRAIAPEGVFANMPSPDGKYVEGIEVAGADSKRSFALFPVAGGTPVRLPITDPQYAIVQWSSDSKSLYVCRTGEVPVRVYRLSIADGSMTPLRDLTPADRAGVVSIAPVTANTGGTAFAYSYYQTLSVMYTVSGLR